MSIPLKARAIDLINLVVAKGSNFFLTALAFAVVGRDMSADAFSEFGYWWSVALMIGGVLLGGLSAALVRVAAVHGSLRHLGAPLRHAFIALLALALLLGALFVSLPRWQSLSLLLAAVALFGVSVQAQTALLSLLRAAEATRANVVASVLVVAIAPLALYGMLGAQRALPVVFALLALAFAIGTATAYAATRQQLAPLFQPTAAAAPGIAGFVANASSFTAVNVFSYAVVNIDFTLFRLIAPPADFTLMATGKIFFERFLLPLLMVFAGAVSLRVLRHREWSRDGGSRLEANLSPMLAAGTLLLVVALVVGYWLFASQVREDPATIAWPWVACAACGYVLYAVNGILFDVLVVRQSLASVVVHVAAFLLLGAAVQAVAIGRFGLPGWAVGWLLFNALVATVLARQGLRLRLAGWGARPLQP